MFSMEGQSQAFVLKGKSKRFKTVNIIAAVTGIIILALFIRIPEYGMRFFVFTAPILLFWLIGDYLYWKKRGVRELHIHSNGISVFRGEDMRVTYIRPEQITDIHVHEAGYRTSLNLLLGKKVFRIPGVLTLYPGNRIYLTSDAFDDKEFNEALARIKQLYHEQHPV